MSTRANYIFKSGRKTLATFYIHHDGYPEGAAEYFHKALIYGNGKINSPDIFFRANDACEISGIHGDIEYLYELDVNTQKIKIYKIVFTEAGNEKSLYIADDLYMFINRYSVVFSSSTKLHEYRRKYSWKSDSEIEQIIKNEKTWHYISAQSRWNHEARTKARCLELVYKELRQATEELVEDSIRYGTDNPNYQHLVVWQYNLMKQLEVLVNIANGKKEE